MFGHPGKKLLFMGCEFATGDGVESRQVSLDWHLLAQPEHAGIQVLVRDLNTLYRDTPALHQLDCEEAGFTWLIADDTEQSVFAWLRNGRDSGSRALVVINFTPEVRRDYRIPVPSAGVWREIFNSDAAILRRNKRRQCRCRRGAPDRSRRRTDTDTAAARGLNFRAGDLNCAFSKVHPSARRNMGWPRHQLRVVFR